MEKKHIIIVWAIVALILVGLINAYLMLRPDPDPQNGFTKAQQLDQLSQIDARFFKKPLDDSAGRHNTGVFRGNFFTNSQGVIYDVSIIQHYLDSIYPYLKQQIEADTNIYSWKLGFYWMINKDKDSVNRLTFCVAPTLVNKKDSTKILDYFTNTDVNYPRRTIPTNERRGGPDSGFVYDEGQLWP